MSNYENSKAPGHHHRGKSSERFLDKNEIVAGLSISTGQTILDAGCGNGYMAKAFSELTGETGRVYALDPDSIAIDILKSETEDTVIEALVGDITLDTGLSASSMDMIYLSTVVHGFSKIQMAGFVKEVRRLLKPDGKLAILEIKKEDTPFGPPMEIRFSPEELKNAISLSPAHYVDLGAIFYIQLFEKQKADRQMS